MNVRCPWPTCRIEFSPYDRDCDADTSIEILCPGCGKWVILACHVIVRYTTKKPSKAHLKKLNPKVDGLRDKDDTTLEDAERDWSRG